MLDLRHLSVFREVATSGSFSGAAHALAYTPSAVSQQMAVLERRVGTSLFVRTPRGMRLTHQGERLLPHACALLEQHDEAEAELEAIAAGRSGRLRVGALPCVTAAFLGGALRRLRSARPELDVHYADGESYETLGWLRDGRVDVAIVSAYDHWPAGRDYDGRIAVEEGGFDWVDLFDDPLMLIVPRGHRLAAETAGVELCDLAGESILGRPGSCPPWGLDLQIACRAASCDPLFEPRYRSADALTMQALVSAGDGVSVLPRTALTTVRPDVVVRPLLGAPVQHVRLATTGPDSAWARDLVLGWARDAGSAARPVGRL